MTNQNKFSTHTIASISSSSSSASSSSSLSNNNNNNNNNNNRHRHHHNPRHVYERIDRLRSRMRPEAVGAFVLLGAIFVILFVLQFIVAPRFRAMQSTLQTAATKTRSSNNSNNHNDDKSDSRLPTFGNHRYRRIELAYPIYNIISVEKKLSKNENQKDEKWENLPNKLEAQNRKQCPGDDLMPGLDTLRYGYDITALDLHSPSRNGQREAIFEFTCDSSRRWIYPISSSDDNIIDRSIIEMFNYTIPDQISEIEYAAGDIRSPKLTVHESYEHYKQSLADLASIIKSTRFTKITENDVNCFGCFASSDRYFSMINEMIRNDSAIAECVSYASIVRASAKSGIGLSVNFAREVQRLQAPYEQSPLIYRRFLERFGTHYAERVSIGGAIRTLSAISNDRIIETYDDDEEDEDDNNNNNNNNNGRAKLEAEIRAQFVSMILDNENNNNNNNNNNDEDDNTSTEQFPAGNITILGGFVDDFYYDHRAEQKPQLPDIAMWLDTIARRPALLDARLRPIDELVEDSRAKIEIRKAIHVTRAHAQMREITAIIRRLTEPSAIKISTPDEMLSTNRITNNSAPLSSSSSSLLLEKILQQKMEIEKYLTDFGSGTISLTDRRQPQYSIRFVDEAIDRLFRDVMRSKDISTLSRYYAALKTISNGVVLCKQSLFAACNDKNHDPRYNRQFAIDDELSDRYLRAIFHHVLCNIRRRYDRNPRHRNHQKHAKEDEVGGRGEGRVERQKSKSSPYGDLIRQTVRHIRYHRTESIDICENFRLNQKNFNKSSKNNEKLESETNINDDEEERATKRRCEQCVRQNVDCWSHQALTCNDEVSWNAIRYRARPLPASARCRTIINERR